jgi:glycolate oxidase iron-sulfur subunit
VQPEAATELGDRKAAAVIAGQATIVVTSNPGCLMQIRSALERSGSGIKTAHIVEVLDNSIRGM